MLLTIIFLPKGLWSLVQKKETSTKKEGEK